MGEAKRRGTQEQRREQAIARNAAERERLFEEAKARMREREVGVKFPVSGTYAAKGRDRATALVLAAIFRVTGASPATLN